MGEKELNHGGLRFRDYGEQSKLLPDPDLL